MYYLVIDSRFATPVYAFLDQHPGADLDFPALAVRPVTLRTSDDKSAVTPHSAGVAIGQNPYSPWDYRLFGSDRAVFAAGFGLIEPRYVGASWASYSRAFAFGRRSTVRG